MRARAAAVLRISRCVFGVLLASHFAIAAQRGRGEDLTGLVEIQSGTLPIIISAPHGGTLEVPDVPPRKGEGLPKGASGFFAGRDTGVEELAHAVSAAIEHRFHMKPYAVVARSHRKFIDFNRPPNIAYEDPDAKPVYDAYHNALKEFCADIHRRFGEGLLLDLHGQGSDRSKVFRGTQNGRTVLLLKQRFGDSAVTGSTSLLGLLKSQGWRVHPDPLDGREQSGFLGGYIVSSYGRPDEGMDAIQLEFGMDYRTAAALAATADTLTEALVEYSVDYLNVLPADDESRK